MILNTVWYVILFILIVFAVIMIISSRRFNSLAPIRGGHETFNLHEIGTGEKILLIPGLGNGIESYNWNMSTDEQREKSGIYEHTESLQQKIADLGYCAITFDPPGHGSNLEYPVPTNVDGYINLLHSLVPDTKIVIGHSIGARVAQAFGEAYKCEYIMIDPTPDFLIGNIHYKKHLEFPDNMKYRKTSEFLSMISASIDKIVNLPMRPKMLLYSLDDSDPGVTKKREYFENLDAHKNALINATHWLHITNPGQVIDAITR